MTGKADQLNITSGKRPRPRPSARSYGGAKSETLSQSFLHTQMDTSNSKKIRASALAYSLATPKILNFESVVASQGVTSLKIGFGGAEVFWRGHDFSCLWASLRRVSNIAKHCFLGSIISMIHTVKSFAAYAAHTW